MEFTSVNKSTNNVPRTPITKDQFKALSDDDKKNYIGFLHSSFNVGSPTIAKMLGISPGYLYKMMRDIGYNWTFIGKKTGTEYDNWDRFLEGNAPIKSNVEILPNCYGNWERNLDKCLECVHEAECYTATPVPESDDCKVSMKMFIEECCKVNDDMNTRIDIFIQVYLAWCRDNEFPPMKKDEIINFIKKEYNATFPKKSGHVYCNICLSYDKFQMYKNKIKYHEGEDRKTINPYMTFAKDKKDIVKEDNESVKISSLDMFIKECCFRTSNKSQYVRRSDFNRLYNKYCVDNKLEKERERSIEDKLIEAHGIKSYKSNGEYVYPIGINGFCNQSSSEISESSDTSSYSEHDNESIKDIQNKISTIMSYIDDLKKDNNNGSNIENLMSASGTFLFRGNGYNIFTELANRFKGDKLSVKVEWSLCTNEENNNG